MIALLKRKILVQLVLIFISISCWMNVLAQAPFLSATASKSTVSVGENFQLTYSLNASGKNFRGPSPSKTFPWASVILM
jgi:phosphopantothenoylcysteine synthetase/decarboxylase